MRFIAEAATTHGGSMDNALKLIGEAKAAGADTIKFQHVDCRHFGSNKSLYEWYQKVRFSLAQWHTIKGVCESEGLKFLCTPQTVQDFEDLLEVGISEVKISSDNATNWALLKAVGNSGVDAFISQMVRFDTPPISNTVYMHCTSEYPCVLNKVFLRHSNEYHSPWGFSDHTTGYLAACMALALGATVFEKHFMLSSSTGPDCGEWAMLPGQLKQYFDKLKEAQEIMG